MSRVRNELLGCPCGRDPLVSVPGVWCLAGEVVFLTQVVDEAACSCDQLACVVPAEVRAADVALVHSATTRVGLTSRATMIHPRARHVSRSV